MFMEAKLPDWFRQNQLAIGLIVAAVLVSLVLAVVDTGMMETPSQDGDGPNSSVSDTDPGVDFDEAAGGNETRVGGDASEANETHDMDITANGIDPSSIEIAQGDAIRLNNLNDYPVVVDWEDVDSGANVTIEGGSSYAVRVRGTEYFKVYPQDPDARDVMYGGPIQIADE